MIGLMFILVMVLHMTMGQGLAQSQLIGQVKK
jgi:hypothetical protein